MHIIISNNSPKAIYEQITDSIKELILNGNLVSEEALPSIRALAHDLRVSVITTKKAYEELEKLGYIETIPGKGSFVKSRSEDFLKEEILKSIENEIAKGIRIANKYSITKDEVLEIFDCLYEENKDEK